MVREDDKNDSRAFLYDKSLNFIKKQKFRMLEKASIVHVHSMWSCDIESELSRYNSLHIRIVRYSDLSPYLCWWNTTQHHIVKVLHSDELLAKFITGSADEELIVLLNVPH